MARSFQRDFLSHAIKDLDPLMARRVAIALDSAILFGALERAEGNASLQDIDTMKAAYEDKITRLKAS